MKRDFIVASVLAITALTGCSSAPKDMGQPFMQNNSKSVALNVAAYAGYPYLLSDNSYDKGLDTIVTSTSNAMLLSSDLAGSMGSIAGGALGLGLGFISGLNAQYPLDGAQIFTAKLQPGEDYKSAATVLRVLKSNYEKRAKDSADGDNLNAILSNPSLDAYVCEEADWAGKADFDLSCFDPSLKNYNYYVKVVRPANGSEFGQVMPLQAGQYGVYLIRSGRGGLLNPKKNGPDAYFKLEHGMFVLGNTNTVLPRVAPRDDGKRLVYIDGKATFI